MKKALDTADGRNYIQGMDTSDASIINGRTQQESPMSYDIFDPNRRDSLNYFDLCVQKIKALNTAGQCWPLGANHRAPATWVGGTERAKKELEHMRDFSLSEMNSPSSPWTRVEAQALANYAKVELSTFMVRTAIDVYSALGDFLCTATA